MPALYLNEKEALHSHLLPSTSSPEAPQQRAPSFVSSHKKLLLSLLAISTVAYNLASSHFDGCSSSIASSAPATLESNSPLVDLSLVQGGAQCVQPSAVPLKKGQEGRSDFVYNEEFKKLEVERFLGALRIPTQMYDDLAHAAFEGPNYDKRFDPFIDFHAYLAKTFLLVHEKAHLAKPNRFNLVYTLKGSEPDLKPLVLAAHQDVVPAQTSLDKWTYPPFEGVFDGETVWGRGASDTKNTLVGLLATLEHLISQGWENRRTVVLAFGFDEEIGGPQGATAIGQHLLDIYGKDGVAMIVDEGGAGVEQLYGKTFVLPGTGEKGNISPSILVETAGGHSSIPTDHTAIGLLSRVVVAIEDAKLFPPTLHPSSPIYGYLSCLNTHGDRSLLPKWLTSSLSRKTKQTQASLDRLAADFAEERGRLAGEYLVRTSKAVTLIAGGHKLNALPESAEATFNTRIDFSQTPEHILDIYAGPVIPIAKAFNLTLIAANSTILVSPKDPQGTITLGVTGEKGLPVAPTTPLKGKAYELFSWASRRVWEKDGGTAADGSGEVIIAPSASTGNTDTKFYWDLTKQIYRFTPAIFKDAANIHTWDERLKFDAHLQGIAWFHELILFADDVEGDDEF